MLFFCVFVLVFFFVRPNILIIPFPRLRRQGHGYYAPDSPCPSIWKSGPRDVKISYAFPYGVAASAASDRQRFGPRVQSCQGPGLCVSEAAESAQAAQKGNTIH